MEGCPEPKLPGKYRYCARHSAEGPQRESAQVIRRMREREYGITHDEYVALLEEQGGVCAICGDGGEGSRSLSVDHDHVTGAVRGLLCNRCNPMLGYARDNIAVLRSAIMYLAGGPPLGAQALRRVAGDRPGRVPGRLEGERAADRAVR